MKKKVNLSDIEQILFLQAPKKYNLCLFDPFGRLEEDKTYALKEFDDNAPNVLVNLADEITSFKGLSLNEFELILDFGNIKKKNISIFKQRKLRYVNNPDGTMRWLFQKRNLKSVLSFYNTSTFRAKVVAKAIQMVHFFRLEQLFVNGDLQIYYQKDLKMDTLLKTVDFDIYSLFMGTKGLHKTAVLALQKGKKTKYYAKIALNTSTLELIENEKRQLTYLNSSEFEHIVLPKIVPTQEIGVLIVSDETKKDMKRSGTFARQHRIALTELFDRSKAVLPIFETNSWDDIQNDIHALQKASDPAIQRMRDLLEQLKGEIDASQKVICGLVHADFTPWNMKVSEDKLYLYDWELSKYLTPALTDLFHFHFQNGILAERNDLESILEQIETSCQSNEIQKLIKTYEIDTPLYLKLYLLKTVSYYLATFLHQASISEDQKMQMVVWESALRAQLDMKDAIEHRPIFIEEFHEELKRTAHAMLKFNAGSLSSLPISSDIDIAVLKGDVNKIITYCKKHYLVNRVRSVRKSFMATLEIFFKDGSFLSLDLIHQFKRKHLQMMPMEPVLRSARPNKHGIVIPDRRFDMEYSLLFYALNEAAIPQKYYRHFGDSDYDSREKSFHYLNDKYELELETYTHLFNADKTIFQRIKNKVKRQEGLSWKDRLMNRLNYISDTIIDITKRKGFIVTFSGVDGVGKSTIVEKVKSQIREKYRKEVVSLRHRPGILPILSAAVHGSKAKAEQVASVTIPRQGKNKSKLSSLLRFSYYYMDYMIGQVYIYFRYILRGKVVVFDRYYFDFITDSERTNIRLNKGFIKTLYAFVLKPKLNILLWANAQEVYRRKQELQPETIKELSGNYKKLFFSYDKKYTKSRYRVIENVNISTTVSSIMEEFAKVA